LAASFISGQACDVADWHFPDIPTGSAYVRLSGAGSHRRAVLVTRLTHYRSGLVRIQLVRQPGDLMVGQRRMRAALVRVGKARSRSR
jgi:hypothetical protein